MAEDKNPPQEDYQKYFDEKQYTTLVIGSNGKADTKKETIVDAIVTLVSPASREEKDNALLLLKKENGLELLIQAIKAIKNNQQKALLVAACWENDMDIKDQQLFFTHLAIAEDPFVSLEAITLLQSSTSVWSGPDMQVAISMIKGAIHQKHTNTVLLEDLLHQLNEA